MTDATARVVQIDDTDEFGALTQAQGLSPQPFGYTGEQRDNETSLLYIRARMYDPVVGRFISRDPVPGMMTASLSLNRYSYVLNNPPESNRSKRL